MTEQISISLEAQPLGEYVGCVKVWLKSALGGPPIEYTIDVRDLLNLRLHLDNALDDLRERMTDDAICGDCPTCMNTRMVHPIRHGRPVAEHCPACQPRLKAARAAFREGVPPTLTTTTTTEETTT